MLRLHCRWCLKFAIQTRKKGGRDGSIACLPGPLRSPLLLSPLPISACMHGTSSLDHLACDASRWSCLVSCSHPCRSAAVTIFGPSQIFLQIGSLPLKKSYSHASLVSQSLLRCMQPCQHAAADLSCRKLSEHDAKRPYLPTCVAGAPRMA